MQFVTAQINRQALVNNVKKIKSKVPNSKANPTFGLRRVIKEVTLLL